MRNLAFALIAMILGTAAARADSVLVLNSEDASYSILSRSHRAEMKRVPIGREPHHLIATPDGSEVLLASTVTNELTALDTRTGERRRVVRNVVDPYQLGFSPDGKWFVTAANRLDHIDIYQADGLKLARRIFMDGTPSHLAFDAESKTVFVTLQETGRVVAFDLASQTLKWTTEVGSAPAGLIMPDADRLIVALTGDDRIIVVDPKNGAIKGALKTGKAAHNFFPRGDGRYWFLSNRVEGTISLLDTQDMKVVATIKVPGGPDDMAITADGKEMWVTQRFLRRVAVVDLEKMKMVASVPVGKSPHGIMIFKDDWLIGGSPLRAASTAGERR
ncbi:MAG: PQQ-binding-like beta-propeller repeat protein [Alphaproteobacteria bacterium]|nr:PQQ-binding-like beta-propeller repeat protein [Alphaproteobacteria bacterium]MBV8412818.1 PQQ-binding-like beta-propeller repeat protein [Alphaproteobacteria bacterium]